VTLRGCVIFARVKEIGRLLEQIHDAELELSDDCQAVAERQESDREVYDLCHVVARQSAEHAERLRPLADRYGEHIEEADDEGPDPWRVELDSMRHRVTELLHRRPASPMAVLHDLRRLFLAAENVAILWVTAEEGARAARDDELLQIATQCRTETERQAEALVAQIRARSAEALNTTS
jgi:hypothetical protein